MTTSCPQFVYKLVFCWQAVFSSWTARGTCATKVWLDGGNPWRNFRRRPNRAINLFIANEIFTICNRAVVRQCKWRWFHQLNCTTGPEQNQGAWPDFQSCSWQLITSSSIHSILGLDDVEIALILFYYRCFQGVFRILLWFRYTGFDKVEFDFWENYWEVQIRFGSLLTQEQELLQMSFVSKEIENCF